MGAHVTTSLDRYGFMPAGGGRMTVQIRPTAKLTPIELIERGPVLGKRGRVIVANLEKSLAQRQAHDLAAAMEMPDEACAVVTVPSAGPGNAVQLEVATADHTEVFTAFGERGKHSSLVLRDVTTECRSYLASEGAVGIHLADQLLLPFAIAGSGRFTTGELTEHTTTNAEVVAKFFEARTRFETTRHGTRVVVE
jgi:RNA 3'-terminal phosphate cyclase (ATP)